MNIAMGEYYHNEH